MCFVVENYLGMGPLRTPAASLRLWLLQGIEPITEPINRIAASNLGLKPLMIAPHTVMV